VGKISTKQALLAFPGVTFQPTGLAIDDGLPVERWQELGRFLHHVEGGLQWFVGDWLLHGERKYGETYKEAMAATGYEYKSLRNQRHVASQIELSRRRDNLPWSLHAEVAALDADEQDELLDDAEANGWTRRQMRQAVAKVRRQEPPAQLPPGVFDVIYADPPWRYDFSETETRKIENQYSTMATEEIAALAVPDRAARDSVLFLWATAPKLREALRVIEAWQFEYRTHAVWDKQIIGMGYWFRGQHELLLVATRGDFPPPPEASRVSSVLSEKRGKHSTKPNMIYDLIERMTPGAQARVELFARSTRPGWSAWGNEVWHD